jgi:phytoene dehydrogenase-like protein
MGGLAESLARVCRDLGVQILTDAEVRAINVVDGQARGVTLTNGRVIDARVVASSVDANLTFLKFLQALDLPASFREAIGRIDYSSASAKINLALRELPNFTCLPSQNGPAPHHRGTIHICDELDWIERAYDDAKYGRPSEKPVIEMTIPSSVDETLAPSGRYVVSMFVQFAPYKLADGLEWDKIKESFADRCIELVGRFAPNFPQAIEHRQVLSPLDLERTFGLTGGNIFQGAMTLHQLMSMRPVPGWADHHTPVKGLYLCGAATHPGGGVLGACGRNAAREILRTGR